MYKIYQVRAGETIDSIAQLFNTTPAKLREINGFDQNYELRVGQYMVVPVDRPQLFDVYVVQKGDNMYAIAKKYGANYKELLMLNGLDENDYIYPNQEILVPKTGVSFYFTENGDTLTGVAEKLGTNAGSLLLQNETIYLMPEQLLVFKKE